MLIEIEKDLKENDVVSLKLSSGEEVISRYVSMDGDNYIVKNPMVLVAGPQGLGMQPFMLSVKADGKFTMQSKNIMCAKRTEEELAKQFIQQTTGLTV